MRDFRTIIDYLKEYIALHEGKTKVYDKDVAALLGISQARFATIKKRNATPYAALLYFCKRNNVPCCALFFD